MYGKEGQITSNHVVMVKKYNLAIIRNKVELSNKKVCGVYHVSP